MNETDLDLLLLVKGEELETNEDQELATYVDSNNTVVLGNVSDVGDSELYWEVEFLNSSRFWVQRVLVPVVVIVGFLGNLATIYILSRRQMRSSTNV